METPTCNFFWHISDLSFVVYVVNASSLGITEPDLQGLDNWVRKRSLSLALCMELMSGRSSTKERFLYVTENKRYIEYNARHWRGQKEGKRTGDYTRYKIWNRVYRCGKKGNLFFFLQGINYELNSYILLGCAYCNRNVMLLHKKIVVFTMDHCIWLHQIHQNNLGRPTRW